jgi:hypothetical protein
VNPKRIYRLYTEDGLERCRRKGTDFHTQGN